MLLSLRAMMTTEFGRKVDITEFCSCAKINGQNGCKCFRIVEIFDFYTKSGLLNLMAFSELLWPDARKLLFAHTQ